MDFQDVAASPTLAKMYEEQGNYAMALIMYKKLYEKKKEDFYQKKIIYLEGLITSRTSKDHSEIGSFVMSDKEKDVFNMSKQEKEELQKKLGKPEDKEEDLSDPELDEIIKKSSTDIPYFLVEKYGELTLEQFFAILASLLGKNRKLNEITLFDIIQAIERI